MTAFEISFLVMIISPVYIPCLPPRRWWYPVWEAALDPLDRFLLLLPPRRAVSPLVPPSCDTAVPRCSSTGAKSRDGGRHHRLFEVDFLMPPAGVSALWTWIFERRRLV